MATSSGLYGKMFIHTILREKIFSIILFLYFVIFNFGNLNFFFFFFLALMLLCIIGSICFFFFFVFFALMLLCSIWFLDVIEPYWQWCYYAHIMLHWCYCALHLEPVILALMFLCLCLVALILLCNICVWFLEY